MLIVRRISQGRFSRTRHAPMGATVVLFCAALAWAEPATGPTPSSQPALDPAGAMPPDTKIYIELSHLDEQFGALLNLLQQAGVGEPLQFVEQMVHFRSPTTQPTIPGLATLLNPTMINEFRKLGDLSLTVDPTQSSGEEPPMVITLQLGHSEGLKPLLLVMLASASKGAEQHDGWSLYRMGDRFELATLNDAVILARPAGSAAAAAQRWHDHKPALADERVFAGGIRARREGGGLILYMNWPEFSRAMQSRPDASAKEFERGERALAMNDVESLWSRGRVEADGVSAQATLSYRTGQAPTYRMIRSEPLHREILRFVPADILGCFATNVSNGAARIEALLKLVALINDSEADEAGKDRARDQLARVEDRLGGDLGEILENISTVALAMMPPDVTRLTHEASGDATTRPARRSPTVPPTFEQMVRSSLFGVVQVKNVAAFDKLLERLAHEIPFASTQPVEVERRTGADGERRIYRVSQQVRLHLARVDQTYVLSLRPELVEAAVAAHAGHIPDLTLGIFSSPVLDETPAEASKLLMLRPDLLINTMSAVQSVEMGFRPGRLVYPPVASMKPAVMYTIERDTNLELAIRVYDLPIMLRTLLKKVPRPPPSPAR